ncbi:MAG: LPS assembly protein LptD [Candidatus Omnitrophica bacterium]|nr:LPS assembly protein LptD [Candidatus Omnitrophota bacterium]
MKKKLFLSLLLGLCLLLPGESSADSPEIAQVPVDQPVIVNGDTVEYLTENKEVQATGKVIVDYRGTKLSCDKLTVNTSTKDAVAEGHVRIVDPKGSMEGEKLIYNFNTKIGIVQNAGFTSPPFFGRTEKAEKLNESHFKAAQGYVTTCDFDRPHFRVKSKTIDMYPGDKIIARDNTLCLGSVPAAYLPYLSQSLKDRNMIVQLSPGYSKKWGGYLLSAYRHNLTDKVTNRLYLDYRDRLGFAEGFGTNFSKTQLGNGDLKFYYTHERPKASEEKGEFERYFARFRHKWNIDEKTTLIDEYYKIKDSKRSLLGNDYNVLKDYFPREYEADSQPISYSLLTHSFSQSSASLMVQRKINPWYDDPQLEKLPEFNYNLPSLQLGELPLYFDHTSQAGSYSMKHKVPAAENADYASNRLDTYNKLSLPVKVSFIDLTPFAATRETIYDKDINGSHLAPRTVFYTGTEASTKFYRIYDAETNFLDLDINGLRHIVTPIISYNYNPEPTISGSRLKQFDGVDSIDLNNSIDFELSNKLQTKRNGVPIDLANFIVSTAYYFHKITDTADFNTDTLTRTVTDKELGNYFFKLELNPYSWMSVHSDAEYDRKNDDFANINYDFSFNCGKERTLAFGQRYAKSGGNDMTLGYDWRLTPKWKLHLYERYRVANDAADDRKGMVKQEYGFTRDLHCWLFDLVYTSEKEHGQTVWCIFRLKAFPEAAIDFSQKYGGSKSGSSNS